MGDVVLYKYVSRNVIISIYTGLNAVRIEKKETFWGLFSFDIIVEHCTILGIWYM